MSPSVTGEHRARHGPEVSEELGLAPLCLSEGWRREGRHTRLHQSRTLGGQTGHPSDILFDHPSLPVLVPLLITLKLRSLDR